MTETTSQIIGEQLFKANEGIAGLKADLMNLEARLIKRMDERFDGIEGRLDRFDATQQLILEAVNGGMLADMLAERPRAQVAAPDDWTAWHSSHGTSGHAR